MRSHCYLAPLALLAIWKPIVSRLLAQPTRPQRGRHFLLASMFLGLN